MDVMRFAVAAISLAGALLASTILVSADAMIPLSGDPLTITSGKVSGTRLSSGVKAYLGIPFAKPPTGELRWKSPQPVSWDGIWNADRKGPECIQVLRAHDINHYFGEEPTSEDCLYLNLWAPAEAKASDGRPVIVFIYGGGGTLGSSGMANYGGENMAKRGAIFVNFNYRVGMLGYMAHPELTQEQGGHSGNYGYLDQNAVLKWLRDNIAKFGGDPEQGCYHRPVVWRRRGCRPDHQPVVEGSVPRRDDDQRVQFRWRRPDRRRGPAGRWREGRPRTAEAPWRSGPRRHAQCPGRPDPGASGGKPAWPARVRRSGARGHRRLFLDRHQGSRPSPRTRRATCLSSPAPTATTSIRRATR